MSRDGGLRPLFRKMLPDAQFTAIESGLTGQGIPDAEYCFANGASGWIEYKKTNGNSVSHIRPEQVGWLERRRRLGGRAFVAILYRKTGGDDELWLIDGFGARWAKEGGLKAVPAAMVLFRGAGPPSRWDWQAIRAALVR